MWGKILKNQNGNVALMFALVVVPLFAAVGMAVDYGQAITSETNLQRAADAAALTAAVSTASEDDARRQEGKLAFHTNFGNREAAVTIQITGDSVIANGHYEQKNAFGWLLGMNTTELGVTAVVMRPKPANAEIALVLDYSGSMNWNGKYQTMRPLRLIS